MHIASPDDAPIIDAPLLHALLAVDEPIALDALAAVCGVDECTAFAMIDQLERVGCNIQRDGDNRVRLTRTSLASWRDYLRWFFSREDGHAAAPRTIEVYRSTSSTQDIVRRLIASHGPAAHGCLVVADEQSAGRGRLGRRWRNPPGAGLSFSLGWVTPAGQTPPTVDRLMLASAVGAAEGIEAACQPLPLREATGRDADRSTASATRAVHLEPSSGNGGEPSPQPSPGGRGSRAPDIRIKWPNDLLIDGRKLGGILIEAAPPAPGLVHAAVIGIGINTHLDPADLPAEMRELADQLTSLVMHGCAVDRLRVLSHVVRGVEKAFADGAARVDALVAEWRRRSTMLDRWVTLQSDGRTIHGRVVDLDPTDGLVVQTESGSLTCLPAATTSIADAG